MSITSFQESISSTLNPIVRIAIITMSVFISSSCSTTKQLQTSKTNSAKSQDSLLVDSDGNKYSIKVLLDGNLWMTNNLNLNTQNSYCYENSKDSCEKYGRLYTYETAKQACSLLGEGWRLPTKVEWRQLTMLYGGTTDSTAARKEAFKVLLNTGTTGFNAVLGGGRDEAGKYARGNAHGFYWSATENDNGTVWYSNFAKGSQALYLQTDGERTEALSVRCVKLKK